MKISTRRNRRKDEGVLHCDCGTTHVFTIDEPVQLIVVLCDCGKAVGWVESRDILLGLTNQLRESIVNG